MKKIMVATTLLVVTVVVVMASGVEKEKDADMEMYVDVVVEAEQGAFRIVNMDHPEKVTFAKTVVRKADKTEHTGFNSALIPVGMKVTVTMTVCRILLLIMEMVVAQVRLLHKQLTKFDS